MVTVGQLLNALNTDIFPNNSKDEFEKLCREREVGIKKYIDTIGTMIEHHIKKPDLKIASLSYWKQEKINLCIKNLSEYISELVNELNKVKIEDYCRKQQFSLIKSSFWPDFTLLMLNSYYGTIVTDIYWVKEITIHEALLISAGKQDISKIVERTPDKIKEIKSLINKNNSNLKHYKIHLETIDEAFKCYERRYYRGYNLLILVSIEALVRSLGTYLIEKQNLKIDPFNKQYNSLDSFLRKIPWKADLQISKVRYTMLTNHHTRFDYNDPFKKIPDPFEMINVSLMDRLDFLRRRFKENRDLIVHGIEMELDKPYNSFINTTALCEVIESILEYQKLYN